MANANAPEAAVGKREKALIGLETRTLSIGDIAYEGIEIGVEAVGPEAARKEDKQQTAHGCDADGRRNAPVDTRENQGEDNHEGQGQSHTEVALKDDEQEHNAGNEGVHHEGIRHLHGFVLLIRQYGRTKHAYGDAGKLRGLQGERSQVNPGLGTYLLAAGTHAGDQHRDEQNDGQAHNPRHAFAQGMRRNFEAEPKGNEAQEHHHALAQCLVPYAAVFRQGGSHGGRKDHEHADAHEEEDDKAQQLVIKAGFLAGSLAQLANAVAKTLGARALLGGGRHVFS